ncbi:hypothetical protein [Nocardia tengchongensis]
MEAEAGRFGAAGFEALVGEEGLDQGQCAFGTEAAGLPAVAFRR